MILLNPKSGKKGQNHVFFRTYDHFHQSLLSLCRVDGMVNGV